MAVETRQVAVAPETPRHFLFPYRTASNAPSAASSTTSPSPTFSHTAPSYHTTATSYEHSATWYDDEHTDSSPNSPASVATHDHSTGFDNDDWFARFQDDIDISDDLPHQKALDKAGEVPVFDAQGNSRAFKTLYSVGDVVGDRQLILFIRHFYCGACQAYVKALTQEISMQTYFTMAIPTSIIVVGCGSPSLIPQYKAATQCPFPIFADPSRQVFKHLGMTLSLNIGLTKKRPEYMQDTSPTAWMAGQIKEISKTRGMKRFRGGNWLQIGGEFLFQDGQIAWCHRMKNYRGHAEINTLKRILDIDE